MASSQPDGPAPDCSSSPPIAKADKCLAEGVPSLVHPSHPQSLPCAHATAWSRQPAVGTMKW